MAAADVVPFVDDDEDEEANALYKGPAKSEDDDASTGTSQGKRGNFGPSGSGKGSDGSSKMPSTAGTAASDDPDEQMLVAPKYTAPDRSGLEAAQGKLTTDSTAIDRKAPGIAPTWKDRLLGGVAGFLSRDAAGGASVTNRKYNQAAAQQKQNIDADTTAVNTQQSKLEAQGQDFEHQLQANRAQVGTANANSLTGERAAKANKYDNAVDPNSIHQNDDGGWEGTTYGGTKQEVGAPKYAQFKMPTTLPGLYAAQLDPKTPADVKAKLPGMIRQMRSDNADQARNSRNPPQEPEGKAEYEDWKAAFKRDNGRAPTADELTQHKSSVRASSTGKSQRSIDDAAATGYRKLQAQINSGELDPNDPDDAKKVQQAKQDIEDQRHQDMGDIGVKHTRFVYDDAIKGHNEGETPRSAARQSSPTPSRGAPPANPANSAPRPPKPGAPIDRAGVQHYLQAAGGDKAKARQMILADKWTIPVGGKKG